MSETKNVYNRVYDRYGFYGIGASYTVGSFLFKMDASFKDGYSLQSKEMDGEYGKKKRNIADTAFAIEYDANGKYTVNLELTNRHVLGDLKELYAMERDNPGLYFQYDKTFLNDTLTFQYGLYHQFQEKNSFHKVELGYSFSDEIQLSIEYVFFQIRDEESFLWNYRNEDRIGVSFKFYF